MTPRTFLALAAAVALGVFTGLVAHGYAQDIYFAAVYADAMFLPGEID